METQLAYDYTMSAVDGNGCMLRWSFSFIESSEFSEIGLKEELHNIILWGVSREKWLD